MQLRWRWTYQIESGNNHYCSRKDDKRVRVRITTELSDG